MKGLWQLEMKHLLKLALFLFGVVTLFGCSRQPNGVLNTKEKQFTILVPAVDMNESLSVIVESKKEYFSSDSEIPLLIVNKSTTTISFQANTDLKLLMYIGDQWVEIQNTIKYSGDNMQLSPHGTMPSDQLHVFVKPDLKEPGVGEENVIGPLRIVVLGKKITGDTQPGQIVGAYTEIPLRNSVAKPTTVIVQSTAEIITFDGGSIHGTITSADNAGEPLSNVIVQLETHPFFNESNQIKAIATTTTDQQGRYTFDQVEPGIYALHTKILLMSGGACESTDWSKSINIEIGSIVTANLSITCSYQ